MPATRTLVILRHAKAAWPEGVADLERPLAPRGTRDAPEAGRWLRDHLARLDLVITSPALRARQTWELAGVELGYAPEGWRDRRLYARPLDELLELIAEIGDDVQTALLVGHNPELSLLASSLSGSDIELSTAGIAVLGLPGGWRGISPGAAQLHSSVTPRAG
jgi:phosphohistidine phosphatase